VFLHRHVVAAASVFQPQLPQLGQTAFKAIQDQSPSYLLIVFTMGGLYLYLLTKEAEWNVLLKMRDTIHCWISIPGLAKNIVDRPSNSVARAQGCHQCSRSRLPRERQRKGLRQRQVYARSAMG